MSKFKDKFGNEYANEALLKLNEFFQALKELPNADKISLVEVAINGNGISLYRQTVHHNGTEKENEILNIKGQFIEKGYIIKNKRK